MSNWMMKKPSSTRRVHWWNRFGRNRKKAQNTRTEPGMRLATLERTVPTDPSYWTPTLGVAVVEDLCWALARDGWTNRRPPVWRRRARRAWRAEGVLLEAKRQRVIELITADAAGQLA